MQTLVENLELLAKGERARLKKICGVDQEDLFEMIAEIKALDPRPALSFEGEVAPPVIPDVLLRPDRQGGWRSEEHTSELQSLMRISYAVFCLTKNNHQVSSISLRKSLVYTRAT